jgi:iron(III) transport system permease protein
MDGAVTGAFRRREQLLALGVAGAVVLVCALAPFLALGAELATGGGEAFRVLARARPFVLLFRSVALALTVTLLALLAGLPLGVLVGRSDLRWRHLAFVVHAFPVFLPPFLVALGWFQLLGTRGLLGSEASSRFLFSEAGLVAVLALTFTPIVTALVALAVQGFDPGLEEAARVVAPPLRVAARILLPAAAPAIALAALVVFSFSFSELGVAMFLRVETFGTAVFARLGGVDYAPGEAFALVLPLLPLALVLVAFEHRFAGMRSLAVLGLRSHRSGTLSFRRGGRTASFSLGLAAALSATPIGALVWRATGGGGFAELGGWLGRAPWNSVWAGGVAATLIAAAGLVLGHALARRLPGAAGLDTVAVLAFLTPAAVLGVGLVAVWNRPSLQWVYGSAAIVVVGNVARYGVVGVRAVAGLVTQTPLHLEEAAASAGAGFLRRLFRLVLPLHARGVGLVWLLAFVLCLRDLELPVLYYPAGGEPLTVRIFTLEANGPEPVVAALAATQVVMTAAAVAAGAWLVGRPRRP